jgi:cytochrome c peroxidase
LANLAYATSLFWDGGVDSLERQVIAPIKDMNEMDQPLDLAVAKVAADPAYRAAFAAAFADQPAPTALGLTRALASYVRSLVSGDSRWDRHRRGDATALSAAEQRGRAIFFGEKGECFHCHDGIFLTNNRFANNGSYRPGGDVGRQRVTLRAVDLGRFRVPSLRNVAVTAPYMHDGSLGTLQEVVDQYARGGRGHGAEADAAIDPVLRPLTLDDGDKADLVAFLGALTDEAFLHDPRLGPAAPVP